MLKLPKKIRNLTDLQICAKALNDLELRAEATQRIIEATGYAVQVANFWEPLILAEIEQALSDVEPETRANAARMVLAVLEPEGISLLDTEPELGIERARRVVRDRKNTLEDKEKSHPLN